MHSTQSEAIDAGREIARNQGSELLVHGRDSGPRFPRERSVPATRREELRQRSGSLSLWT
jgi:hypothetical protein